MSIIAKITRAAVRHAAAAHTSALLGVLAAADRKAERAFAAADEAAELSRLANENKKAARAAATQAVRDVESIETAVYAELAELPYQSRA